MRKQSLIAETLRKLCRNKGAMTGIVIIAMLLLTAMLAPIIAPSDPNAIDLGNRLLTPCATHLFGTDQFGRDILSRIIYGSQISLAVGFSAVAVGLLLGVLIGSSAGYYGGIVDHFLMRTMDTLYAFPAVLLALAIMGILGQGLLNLVLAAAIPSIPGFARVTRSTVLAQRETVYVEAARAYGASSRRIVWKYVLPNSIAPVIVMGALRISTAILVASSLSFLGFGIQPPTPEWGAMLSAGRGFIVRAPHLSIIPGLFIMLVVLGFNLAGDGLRDALDPRLRG